MKNNQASDLALYAKYFADDDKQPIMVNFLDKKQNPLHPERIMRNQEQETEAQSNTNADGLSLQADCDGLSLQNDCDELWTDVDVEADQH